MMSKNAQKNRADRQLSRIRAPLFIISYTAAPRHVKFYIALSHHAFRATRHSPGLRAQTGGCFYVFFCLLGNSRYWLIKE